MILTAPVIYALIIPVLLLDVFVAVYQTVCFPVYGIPRVRRSDYLAFDREQLAYLNAIEKLNCAYWRGHARGEAAEVSTLAGSWIRIARVQAVCAGLQLADHGGPSSCTASRGAKP